MWGGVRGGECLENVVLGLLCLVIGSVEIPIDSYTNLSLVRVLVSAVSK